MRFGYYLMRKMLDAEPLSGFFQYIVRSERKVSGGTQAGDGLRFGGVPIDYCVGEACTFD